MAKKKQQGGENALTAAQIKQIAEAATKAAIEAYRQEAERESTENRDRRLYNTRLLMEKYRGLVKYSEAAIYDASQLDDDMELVTLMQLMGVQRTDKTLSIESIQARAARTRVVLDHINRMLDYYRYRCEKSGKPELIRKWQTVSYLYIDEDEKTVQEIADMLYVDERTVYRYNQTALQDLCALFFGVID